VLELLSQNKIIPSFIPAGYISLVQPLNISVNKPLKERIRDLTDEQIFQLESAEEFEKWKVDDRRIMTTHGIRKAFYQFHTEKADLIRTSFRKVGLALPIDGTFDHKLDIKGFTDLEIGNWGDDLDALDDRADVADEKDQELELVSIEVE